MENRQGNGMMPREALEDISLVTIEEETVQVTEEFLKGAGIGPDDLVVVGCSSSEIAGQKIGTYSSEEVADVVVRAMMRVMAGRGCRLAAQCCEHLNRALIVERETARMYGYEQVNVVPMPKAGGSFATKVYQYMTDPVAVEHVKAVGGMDIGDTLIGMHLKEVAVPLRLTVAKIGEARVVCARTRCKFVGGSRAQYDEKLL